MYDQKGSIDAVVKDMVIFASRVTWNYAYIILNQISIPSLNCISLSLENLHNALFDLSSIMAWRFLKAYYEIIFLFYGGVFLNLILSK